MNSSRGARIACNRGIHPTGYASEREFRRVATIELTGQIPLKKISRTFIELRGQTFMTGARYILIALLTVLWWPSAAANRHTRPALALASSHAPSLSGCSSHETADLSGTDQAISHAGKRFVRRTSSPPVTSEEAGYVSSSANKDLRSIHHFRLCGSLEFCAALARTWQFEQRTALDPRAPSLV